MLRDSTENLQKNQNSKKAPEEVPGEPERTTPGAGRPCQHQRGRGDWPGCASSGGRLSCLTGLGAGLGLGAGFGAGLDLGAGLGLGAGFGAGLAGAR